MPLIVETHRSGVFTFQVGLDLTRLQPLIDKINYGHRLFSSLPLLPDIASQLEKETLLSSIHGTDTIEGGTLTEDEILQVIESIPEITQEEHKCRISNLAQAIGLRKLPPYKPGKTVSLGLWCPKLLSYRCTSLLVRELTRALSPWGIPR